MEKFQIRSPLKVILHGEHAVVYQKPALAAAVGLCTKLQFRPQPHSQVATFQLETLNCSLELQLQEFEKFLANFRDKYPGSKLDCSAKLLEEVRLEVGKQTDGTASKPHMEKAFLSIYFLLAGTILSSPQGKNFKIPHGFQVHIDSELGGVGAGVGSSASFGAALAATFLLLSGHFDKETYLLPESQALISQWAFESERIMHGMPSGVDNTVCTYGGMVRFVKGQGFQSVKIQRPLNILLVDTHISRSTADIIANVRHLIERFPKLVEAIWAACEELVNEAIPLYEAFGDGHDDSEKFEKLERLFQINNDLLKAIGVSHPKLEQIFTISFKRGFFSKLTGAGAGGFAIILLPENYASNEVYKKLTVELEAAGFGVHATTAGGDGLRLEPLED